MDCLFQRILQQDANGILVLVESNVPHWSRLLLERLGRLPGFPLDRVILLPRQSTQNFWRLIRVTDVMLDTLHFNGMNTSLEAFALGTPVVTLPGAFQRGRHTLGMYRKMEFVELVADSEEAYVNLALKLGTDRPFRDYASEQIK
jgi:predicted O-linked N-acetylglucosamine transferase (SPINDLY family)